MTTIPRQAVESDESEDDESTEKKSFSEKGESSEDESRGKTVRDGHFSNEDSENEEEGANTDDEVELEKSDELALDDIGESSSTKRLRDCESGSLRLGPIRKLHVFATIHYIIVGLVF